MKVGIIATPNEKGQIVIPQEVRKALGITAGVALNITVRGNAIHVYPVEEVISRGESEQSYVKLLEKTQGTWGEDDWTAKRKQRKTVEHTASRKRKRVW